MDKESKKRFDSLSILWKGAWDNFHKRAIYEWKICFIFWTAFVGLISSLMLGRIKLELMYIGIWVGLIGGIFTILHIWWIRGVKNAHMLDRLIAIHYERIMQEISKSQFTDELEKKLKKTRSNWEKVIDYSHGLQMGITILLFLTAIIITIAIK